MSRERDLHLERPTRVADALPDRELSILTELAREGDARVAFQGLRRRLDVHQQALVRTLRRLESRGLVARDPAGYRLTEAGFAALEGRSVSPVPGASITLVSALLPPHVEAEAVAELLGRRWFRGLRWYGQSGGPGEIVLTWTTEAEGARVRVRAGAGTVTVESDVPPGGHPRFAGAHAVLSAIAELYGLAPPGPSESLVTIAGDAPGFAA
ncbi:MAG TPA: MarR family transcriptional regulator [Candidatus Thermoplasmatota archaeon]|nr:MarR family transcriptional regulator [Candidatus Thermoplasmatota archaeon]